MNVSILILMPLSLMLQSFDTCECVCMIEPFDIESCECVYTHIDASITLSDRLIYMMSSHSRECVYMIYMIEPFDIESWDATDKPWAP